MCGTYMFTAGVLQSSGQDLGCSSPQCLPLPLGTEHVELPLLLLTQRVAITHLKTKKRHKESMSGADRLEQEQERFVLRPEHC